MCLHLTSPSLTIIQHLQRLAEPHDYFVCQVCGVCHTHGKVPEQRLCARKVQCCMCSTGLLCLEVFSTIALLVMPKAAGILEDCLVYLDCLAADLSSAQQYTGISQHSNLLHSENLEEMLCTAVWQHHTLRCCTMASLACICLIIHYKIVEVPVTGTMNVAT